MHQTAKGNAECALTGDNGRLKRQIAHPRHIFSLLDLSTPAILSSGCFGMIGITSLASLPALDLWTQPGKLYLLSPPASS